MSSFRAAAWKKTLEERDKHWLSGPFTQAEVQQLVGHDEWIANRRFPLEQKDKIRLIDDCNVSGLNSAYASTNKLQLLNVDALVALVLCAMKCAAEGSRAVVHLSDGQRLPCHVSDAWQGNLQLVGRTLDLESAYKQMGPKPEDAWVRVLVVFNPELNQPSFFLSEALMFGSAASVYAFNRVSRSIWHIQTELFAIWSTVFYDDFPTVEPTQTASSARETAAGLLDALGWRFAREGKKALPYESCFNVLGVSMDLGSSQKGLVTICNKADRIDSLLNTVCDILDRQKISASLASSLHGQLNFAQGQFLGAEMKPAMSFLSQVANAGWDTSCKQVLGAFAAYVTCVLRSCKPKRIAIKDEQVPVLVFSDGAWEPTSSEPAGAGLVLVDPVTGTKLVSEVIVPQLLIDHWLQCGKKQLITELELLPIAVGLSTYSNHLRGRRVLWFIDNNSVRDMIVKGSTKTPSLFCLLAECYRLTGELQIMWWVSRVPSKSNIADMPSSGDSESAARVIRGKVTDKIRCPQMLVDASLKVESFVDYMQYLTEKLKDEEL